MTSLQGKKKIIEKIEEHLKNYGMYKAAIKNYQKQLDYIMPSMTVSYELVEGSSGTFSIQSSTEKYAIDRIESARALFLYEETQKLTIIIDCIHTAYEQLDKNERFLVENLYFNNKSFEWIGDQQGYSASKMYKVREKVRDKLLISLKGIVNL